MIYGGEAKAGGSGSDRDASSKSDTPRDDRFSTPRGTGRSSSVASSNEDYLQWATPRSARLDSERKSYESSPRVSARSDYDQQFATPRSNSGYIGMDDSNHSRGGSMDGSNHSQYASPRGAYGHQSYGYKGWMDNDSSHSIDTSGHSYYSNYGIASKQPQHHVAVVTQQPMSYVAGNYGDYRADAKYGYNDEDNMYDDDLDEAMHEGTNNSHILIWCNIYIYI